MTLTLICMSIECLDWTVDYLVEEGGCKVELLVHLSADDQFGPDDMLDGEGVS